MAGNRANRIAVFLLLAVIGANARRATVHTVFPTECGKYFTWQSMGMIVSHRKSGQQGPLTRIMSCTPEEWAALTDEEKNVVPTHVAPSFTRHPRTGDHYSAYNKPGAVIDWLARTDVKEDYVLIIDADMIMRRPFIPEFDGAKPGTAVSAYFGYMKGVSNKLALKHVPEVEPRNDTLAGPVGRRGDMVGGFTMMHIDDLRRVAPLWLKYTEDVRFDPDAWELTGDAYSKNPGDKPWISEMYGYSYACAKANVWHVVDHSAMLYPGYETLQPPKVLHYGLLWKVDGTDYEFDKHWHYQFEPFKCPPWDLSAKKAGLFPHPPRASSFKTTGSKLLRDLLAIQVPVTLNQAFCEHHRKNCPASEQLSRECDLVEEYAADLDARLAEAEGDLPDPCRDMEDRCPQWAKSGECDKNAGYMLDVCRLSCGMCQPRIAKPGVIVKSPIMAEPDAVRRQNEPEIDEDEDEDEDVDVDEDEDEDEGEDEDDDINIEELEDSLNEEDEDGLNGAFLDDSFEEQQAEAETDTQHHADEDEDKTPGVNIPELKLRCTRFPSWSAEMVKKCMVMAKDNLIYDPTKDGGAAELHAQAHTFASLNRANIKELGAKGRVKVVEFEHRAVELEKAAEERLGPFGMIAWGGSAVVAFLLLLYLTRKNRKAGGGFGMYGRHVHKYGRVE